MQVSRGTLASRPVSLLHCLLPSYSHRARLRKLKQSRRAGVRLQGTINVAVSLPVLLVPVHGLVEPILPGDELLPTQLLERLTVDGIAQVCGKEEASRREDGTGKVEQREEITRNLEGEESQLTLDHGCRTQGEQERKE